MKTRCPNCGLFHTIEESQPNIFQSTQRFPTVATYTPSPSKENGNGPSVGSHVIVPFLQSIVPGLFLSPLGAILGMAGVYFWEGMNHREMTTGGVLLMVAGGIFSTTCIYGFYQWHKRLPFFDSLLYALEEYTQQDLNHDNVVGEPKKVEIELKENGILRKTETFAIPESKLIRLARAIKEGQSFSNRTAQSCGISREDFETELRDKFVGRGWATWVDVNIPTLGVKLTDEGEDWVVRLASSPLPRQYRE